MDDKKMLKTGIFGTALMSLCCFTPTLVILFGAVGLTAVLAYLDYVLLPALGVFILLTLFALWKRQQRLKNCGCEAEGDEHA
jgi:mercuric ion transport protein